MGSVHQHTAESRGFIFPEYCGYLPQRKLTGMVRINGKIMRKTVKYR